MDRETFVDYAYWILLGRAPTRIQLEESVRGLNEATRITVLIRLLTIPEGIQYRAERLISDDDAIRVPLERGLRGLGSDEDFVRRAYECLLGRNADEDGRHHYCAGLANGDTRVNVVRAIAASDEFRKRATALMTFGIPPRDVQLCELANPAKWDNPEWLAILRSLGHTDDKPSMHRKAYEFTQLIFGCRRLGVLSGDARVVSVGAGHELALYWFANEVRQILATDMYGGRWQAVQGREADPRVLIDPDLYAPFPYRRDRLLFAAMDGRALGLRDGSFDIAYSLSSIEHVGGFDGAAKALREMGRVVRRGGIVAIATEYVLSGPPHEETFQADELRALIRQPGLELVQPVDERVYDRYEYSPVDLYANPYQSPHMVVRFGETMFTTVMVFLRKI